MNVRDAISQRLRERMIRMRTVLEKFNDDSAERAKVGPKWNVRDLVGHFLYWCGEASGHMAELEKTSVVGVDTTATDVLPRYDYDRVNDDVFRKYRRMSFVMLLPQLRTAEEKLLHELGRVDSKKLVGDTPVRLWIDAHLNHYDHHWRGLKEAAAPLG